MTLLYCIFFGAGATALAYSTIGRRIGYTNTQNLVIFLAVVFVLATIFFYTILAYILHTP